MADKERRAHPRQELETPAEISVEQSPADEPGRDKRSHERIAVSYEINVEAGLRVGGQEVVRLKLVGKTVDMSLGGMLIHVEKEVLPGARCHVHFLDSKGQIAPEQTGGRVRRSVRRANGFHLAVQFDQPLEYLEPS